jgi:hypothetical protein
MKKQVFLVFGLMFIFSGLAFAQTKTVTNADLEKYRQKRLAAEKEYRENYREMGFPSPEELEKQNEESARERSELAQRLRAEKIAKQNQARQNSYYQNRQNSNQTRYPYPNPNFIDYGQYQTSTYVYPNFFNRRFFRNTNRRNVRRGNFFRFGGSSGPNVRNNNRPRLIIRSDRRLNRRQRGN